MLVAIGSDHAGYEAKQALIPYLKSLGLEINDLGTHSPDSVDYPDFGHQVGLAVSQGSAQRGIVVCGTGIGISIAANKIKGIRAALCTSVKHAELSRQHNDANVLAMGARMTDINLMKEIIKTWFGTSFEGGRHQTRVKKIEV